VLAVLTTLVLAAGCGGSREQADPQMLTGYVERYVQLLNAGDSAGLAEHLSNPAQPQDPADRVAQFGHRGLHDVRSSWTTEFPDVYRVTISVLDSSNAKVQFVETIGWESGHWVMAPLNPRHPAGAASIEPPSPTSSS
jgi:hypothetical protein